MGQAQARPTTEISMGSGPVRHAQVELKGKSPEFQNPQNPTQHSKTLLRSD